jgi:hypothetical protein
MPKTVFVAPASKDSGLTAMRAYPCKRQTWHQQNLADFIHGL